MSDPSTTNSTVPESNAALTGRRARIGLEITFGMGLARGLTAIALGLLLLVVPDRTTSMLANKMGFFWLFSGIAMLRLNRDDSTRKAMGNRTSTAAAVIGIFAGLLMVTRRLTEQVVPEAAVITLLGVVIMITGLLHLGAEVRVGGVLSRGHRVLHALMGFFELILGLMLVISPLDQSQFTYWVVTIWSLIFGVLAIGQAISQWAANRKAV